MSGVRSSCDTSRRKWVFTALARSASSFARLVTSSAASSSRLRAATSPASARVARLRGELALQDLARALHRDEVRDPRAHLLGDEGLHEIVLRAVAQQLDAERVVRPRGEHQHRHAVELVVPADGARRARRRSCAAS